MYVLASPVIKIHCQNEGVVQLKQMLKVLEQFTPAELQDAELIKAGLFHVCTLYIISVRVNNGLELP